jgi:hypothetical protein
MSHLNRRAVSRGGLGESRQPLSDAPEWKVNSLHSLRGELKEMAKRSLRSHNWLRMRSVSSPPFARSGLQTQNVSRPHNANNKDQIKPETTESRGLEKLKLQALMSVQNLVSIRPRIGVVKADWVIYLSSVPSSVGLSSIIAQVSGGPLEKIISKPDPSMPNMAIIELHFLHSGSAQRFYRFASSGRLRINGRVYYPQKQLRGPVPPRAEKVKEAMLYGGACRCVVLMMRENIDQGQTHGRSVVKSDLQVRRPDFGKSDIEGKPPRSPVTLEFTIDDIKGTFGTLGRIIQISPMARKRVTICIQYADTKSAISATEMFVESVDHPLWQKFYKRWGIAYGLDPTDRTCPPPLGPISPRKQRK